MPLSFKAAEGSVEKIPCIFSLHAPAGWTGLQNKVDPFLILWLLMQNAPYSLEHEQRRGTEETAAGIGGGVWDILVPSGPVHSQLWM